jgi:hypothetical protein
MPSNLENKDLDLNNGEHKEGIENTPDSEVKGLSESISDAIDLENIETLTMGNVSENSSSGKDKKDTSLSSTNNGSLALGSYTSIKLPSPKMMRKDVELKIRDEISELSKKALKLAKSSHKNGNFFELTIVMRKLRKLKFLLNNLVKFSVDQVKNLWFRFVKERK